MIDLIDDDYCFGCGRQNPVGLRLDFSLEGEEYTCSFTAGREHQGYRGIVHGGIISTLMDEVMGRFLILKGLSVVTVKLEVSFRKPVPVGEPLTITAKEAGRQGKFVKAVALITSGEGITLSSGEGTFAVLKGARNG
jgi:acyl-coenzyme A thioesterase PaaI-like protein